MKPRRVKADERQDHLDLNQADAYGRSFSDVYDRWYDGVSDAEATAEFVAARCGSRPVLEIGIGSGRLATPLLARGCTVIGVDGSQTMLDQIPDRDGGDRLHQRLHLVRADMRALPLRGPIGVALIAFNTLFNLASEAEQLDLLQNLSTLVGQDGRLIVEALDVTPLLGGPADSLGVRDSGPDWLVVTATQLAVEQQLMTGQHLEIDDSGVSIRPWRLRWLTPEQLDRLCRLAGLELIERFGSWSEDAFTDASETHISVYVAPRS